MNFRPVLLRLPLVICVWLAVGLFSHLAARAGGAGGHSSGRSGGRSHGGSSYGRGTSFHRSSGGVRGSSGDNSFNGVVFFIIMVVIVLVVVMKAREMLGARAERMEPLENEPDFDSGGVDEFVTRYPDFDLAAFNAKVRSAFLGIQAAWSAQDVAGIRRFISDGMYQRFATQFRMMALLEQRNVLDEIRIFEVMPVAARTDGPLDAMDVRISAAMHDAFVCGADPSLNSEGDEAFVEYWSFVRKRGAGSREFDLFTDKTCPSCGAELPKDMGELCRCAYCQVMVNSGDFDWVLAEITQERDYGNGSRMSRHVSPGLAESIAAIAPECPDFSTQLAEDKASNAFMQIMTAIATGNPASVRRFVSDEVLAAVTAMIPERRMVFNRIYLNESVLLDAARVEARHRLTLGLLASMQRVELLPGGGISHHDAAELRSGFLLTLERDADAVPEKGSLYQHQCAACGGAVGDTLDVNCQYCGTALNSTRNEWIVSGFSPMDGGSL